MSKAAARFFLDANVLIYSFDIESRIKQKRACDLIDAAPTAHRGVISYQVVQEFLNAAIRKFASAFSENEAELHLKRVLMPLCHVFPTIGSVLRPYRSRAKCGSRSTTL